MSNTGEVMLAFEILQCCLGPMLQILQCCLDSMLLWLITQCCLGSVLLRGLCSGGQLLQCWAHGDESLSDAGFFLFRLFAFILLFSQSEVMWECSGSGVRCVMGAPSFPTSRSVRKGKEVYTAHSLLHYFYPKIKGIQILTSYLYLRSISF